MSIHLAKAILGRPWMIDPNWAQSQAVLIMQVLKGGTWANTFRNSDQSYSRPYFIDTTTGGTYDMRGAIGITNTAGMIAVVPVTGPIMKYDGDCGEAGSVQRTNWINAISKMQHVKACILLMDTPGGMIDGLHTVSNAIANMPQHTVAFVDDGMSCSAGMYMAAHCNEIVASKDTDTVGSIGVMASIADFNGYYEEMGIKVKTIYAPQSTEKNKDYRDAFEKDDTTLIEGDLEVNCQHFIDTVSARRPKAVKHQEKWSHGATFYAKEAVKIGLVDRIESLENTIKRVGKQALNPTKTKSMERNISTQMAIVIGAAMAESFAVTAEGEASPASGFILSEDHIVNIAGKLITLGGADTQSKLALQQSQAQLADLQQKYNDATANASTLQEQVTNLTTERDNLQTQVEELGKGASGTGTTTTATTDAAPGTKTAGMPAWYKPDGSESKLERAASRVGAALDES